MWSRASRSKELAEKASDSAGFTLIEVLVALAVLAIVLGAIGAVVATNVKGVHTVGTRLPLYETAQGLLAALPGRDALRVGTQTGTTGDLRWRVDVVPVAAPMLLVPVAAPTLGTKQAATWMPVAVSVRVQAATGAPVRLDTVRLVRRPPA